MKLSNKLQAVLVVLLVCLAIPAVLFAGTYEDVSFTAEEEVAVLDMANQATLTQLTGSIGVTSTSANNIITARPISTMTQLAAVSYVGPATLSKLKAYVPTWTGTVPPPPPPPPPTDATGGTYDGVVFSAAEEGTALTIANTASLDQLKGGGVAATPAGVIVNNRAWANLKAVADFSGIGAATMTALKNMVPTWGGVIPPPPPPPPATGGTYDGVVFTGEQEAKALDICNKAGLSQLRTISAASRNVIYDKRPWASLSAVSAASGIGATAMTALKNLTAAWVIGVSGKTDTVRMLKTTPPPLNTAVRIHKCRIVSVIPNSTYMVIADAGEANYNDPANQIRAYVPYGVGTIVESDPVYQWFLGKQEIYVSATYLEFPAGSGQRSLRWINVFATHVTLP